MKCILCGERKAKRECPAGRARICPQCCGEKRVLEIACPDSCPFLEAGRERDARSYRKVLGRLPARDREIHERVLERYPEAIARLEYTLARQRIRQRDLADRHARDAVDLLLESCRAEDAGIVYERTSEDPRVEGVRREIRAAVESVRRPREGEGMPGLRDSGFPSGAVVECLAFVRALIDAFGAEYGADSAYVDFLARFFPGEETGGAILAP
ncbi:MAG: hypothetical protein JXP48_08430 [Acidobacteria bacterium]|nr:hypothetical protein [Acidobacteriota bacterium]